MVTRRSSTLFLAAMASLAVLMGSSHGGGAHLASGLDAVFDAVGPIFASDARPETVDLHDGKSAVATRWQPNFERFAQSDRAHLPAAGGVVFVGSSSIDYWSDLPTQFPTQNVTQRGLAGATMSDCARYVDRLILPYRPRVVVVYAGDNDLAAGVKPEQIVADYAALVRQVHRELPATKVVLVSIKPSPSRAVLMPRIERTNALLAAYTRTDPRLDFVDIFPVMLDRDAHVRSELFRADGLHMNRAGYALWRDAIAARL
jgi:lysophospholipase L1-like esterase